MIVSIFYVISCRNESDDAATPGKRDNSLL